MVNDEFVAGEVSQVFYMYIYWIKIKRNGDGKDLQFSQTNNEE